MAIPNGLPAQLGVQAVAPAPRVFFGRFQVAPGGAVRANSARASGRSLELQGQTTIAANGETMAPRFGPRPSGGSTGPTT